MAQVPQGDDLTALGVLALIVLAGIKLVHTAFAHRPSGTSSNSQSSQLAAAARSLESVTEALADGKAEEICQLRIELRVLQSHIEIVDERVRELQSDLKSRKGDK